MSGALRGRRARAAICALAVASASSAGCAEVLGLGGLHARAAAPYLLVGRWDTTTITGSAIAEWPGSGAIVTFSGTGVAVNLLESPNGSTGYDSLAVEVDGAFSVTVPLDPAHCPGGSCSRLPLASGLTGSGAHTVAFYKTTDSAYGGRITLQSFAADPGGVMLAATRSFSHQIEFIGDDISAGRAVLTPPDCKDITNASSSEYLSYAALVARRFDAERMNLSVSGAGVYASNSAALLPDLYDRLLPTEQTLFSTSPAAADWNPELVVVDLGGYGDFATTQDSFLTLTPADRMFETKFESAYEAFLRTVRAAHPAAFILVVAGNGYSGAIDASVAPTLVEKVVQDLLGQGETAATMRFFDAKTLKQYTCNVYPNVADQQALAQGVEDQILASALGFH